MTDAPLLGPAEDVSRTRSSRKRLLELELEALAGIRAIRESVESVSCADDSRPTLTNAELPGTPLVLRENDWTMYGKCVSCAARLTLGYWWSTGPGGHRLRSPLAWREADGGKHVCPERPAGGPENEKEPDPSTNGPGS